MCWLLRRGFPRVPAEARPSGLRRPACPPPGHQPSGPNTHACNEEEDGKQPPRTYPRHQPRRHGTRNAEDQHADCSKPCRPIRHRNIRLLRRHFSLPRIFLTRRFSLTESNRTGTRSAADWLRESAAAQFRVNPGVRRSRAQEDWLAPARPDVITGILVREAPGGIPGDAADLAADVEMQGQFPRAREPYIYGAGDHNRRFVEDVAGS